jgi:hypothetical protein
MARHPDVPELPEQYRGASGSAECRVTLRELRLFFSAGFQLDASTGPVFPEFLQKIHYGPFFTCHYKAARREKLRDTTPPYRMIRKYPVRTRPVP